VNFRELPDDSLLHKSDFVRTRQNPGIVPHGRSDWDKRVKAGMAPKPIYPLGPHAPLWTAGDIRAYLAKLTEGASEKAA